MGVLSGQQIWPSKLITRSLDVYTLGCECDSFNFDDSADRLATSDREAPGPAAALLRLTVVAAIAHDSVSRTFDFQYYRRNSVRLSAVLPQHCSAAFCFEATTEGLVGAERGPRKLYQTPSQQKRP